MSTRFSPKKTSRSLLRDTKWRPQTHWSDCASGIAYWPPKPCGPAPVGTIGVPPVPDRRRSAE